MPTIFPAALLTGGATAATAGGTATGQMANQAFRESRDDDMRRLIASSILEGFRGKREETRQDELLEQQAERDQQQQAEKRAFDWAKVLQQQSAREQESQARHQQRVEQQQLGHEQRVSEIRTREQVKQEAQQKRQEEERQRRAQMAQTAIASLQEQGRALTPELQRAIGHYVDTDEIPDALAEKLFGPTVSQELAVQREQRLQREAQLKATETLAAARGYTGKDEDAFLVIRTAPPSNVRKILSPMLSERPPEETWNAQQLEGKAPPPEWSEAQIRAAARAMRVVRQELPDLPLSRLRDLLVETFGDAPTSLEAKAIRERAYQLEAVRSDVAKTVNSAREHIRLLEEQSGKPMSSADRRKIFEAFLARVAQQWNVQPQDLEYMLQLASQ